MDSNTDDVETLLATIRRRRRILERVALLGTGFVWGMMTAALLGVI